MLGRWGGERLGAFDKLLIGSWCLAINPATYHKEKCVLCVCVLQCDLSVLCC